MKKMINIKKEAAMKRNSRHDDKLGSAKRGRTFIVYTGSSTGCERKALYFETPDFMVTSPGKIAGLIRENRRKREDPDDIFRVLIEAPMLLINAEDLKAKYSTQECILSIIDKRALRGKDTILSMESPPGILDIFSDDFAARIVSATKACELEIGQIIDRRYNLPPALPDFCAFDTCSVKDVIEDEDQTYLLVELSLTGNEGEEKESCMSVVCAENKNSALRYRPVSERRARKIFLIERERQIERETLHNLTSNEKTSAYVMMDLKGAVNQFGALPEPCNTPLVDFHIHTTASDGMLTPRQVLTKAVENGLLCVAFTDHNTICDDEEIIELAEEFYGRIQIVHGAEISAIYTDKSGKESEVHIGALGIKSSRHEITFHKRKMTFSDFLAGNRPDEEEYIRALQLQLQQCGINLPSYHELKYLYPETSCLGSTHIARWLVAANQAASVEEAYDKYLGTNSGSACVPASEYADFANMKEVIRIIEEAGGIPVLCHPFKYQFDEDELSDFIDCFRRSVSRACALEVGYRKYDSSRQEMLQKTADLRGMWTTSGSGFHGRFPGDNLLTPEELLSQPAGKLHLSYRLKDVLGEQLRPKWKPV